jgi:hypothetical protein
MRVAVGPVQLGRIAGEKTRIKSAFPNEDQERGGASGEMARADSLLEGEPSREDYDRADDYIRQANARDRIPPERKALLMEFRRQIARIYQAERQMRESRPGGQAK